MNDQRFKYYTGYEVDNEPSDDDDEVDIPSSTAAIAQGHRSSESSDEEFDRPIREFIEKSVPPTTSNTTRKSTKNSSKSSNAFENEMEDELDQIYNNFISRGTFELPLSTQKSPTKKKPVIHLQEAEESESDDDNDEVDGGKLTNEDDLLYDPDQEDEDEKWMTNERIKSQGGAPTNDKDNPISLGPTDAVLNCPGCMVLISHDCQRHETIKNQYRAMFVFNCTIDENRVVSIPNSNEEKPSKKKRIHQNKRLKTGESSSTDPAESEEILRPVLCSECGTEIGVYEPKDELYHFANVLASH